MVSGRRMWEKTCSLQIDGDFAWVGAKGVGPSSNIPQEIGVDALTCSILPCQGNPQLRSYGQSFSPFHMGSRVGRTTSRGLQAWGVGLACTEHIPATCMMLILPSLAHCNLFPYTWVHTCGGSPFALNHGSSPLKPNIILSLSGL